MLAIVSVILGTGAPGAWRTASEASAWSVMGFVAIVVGGSLGLAVSARRGRRRGRPRTSNGARVWVAAATCGVALRAVLPSVGPDAQLVEDAVLAALFAGIGLATIHALVEDARPIRRRE